MDADTVRHVVVGERVGDKSRCARHVEVEAPAFVELTVEQRKEAVAALAVLLRPLVEQIRQRREDEHCAA